MLLTQQVVHCLDRVERGKRNLHKNGVPVAHGSVPKAGQFESLEFSPVLALRTDEASGAVDIVGQIERLPLVVFHGAYQVDGIKVSTLGEHAHVLLVCLVYLAALKYLEAYSAVLIIRKEGAAARFADILHHSAYAHGAVELLAQIDYQLGVFKLLDVGLAAAQVALHEAYHLFKLSMGVVAGVEQTQVAEGTRLKRDEYAGKNLLVVHGVALEAVGHNVVYVLSSRTPRRPRCR